MESLGIQIDRETIERVARLSRIRLTSEQEEQLLRDFQEILTAFSSIDEAEADCEPAFHPIEIRNILREDEPHATIPPDEILERMKTLQRFIRGPRMQ